MSKDRRKRHASDYSSRTQRKNNSVQAANRKFQSLGGEQIEGRHAVREILIAGKRRVREIVVVADSDLSPVMEDIVSLAGESKISVRELPRSRFAKIVRTEAPQGVVAFVDPLTEYDIDELLIDDSLGRNPFLLVFDGVTDPGNLGAVLRSAECAGVTGVVLSRHRSVGITPTVAKAAAGAIEHIRFTRVAGIPSAIDRLSKAGVWTVGLDTGGSTSIYKFNAEDRPLALVLGAEGKGLSRLVRERCDDLVHIPLNGVLPSLNVSAAAAVALFEVVKQKSLS